MKLWLFPAAILLVCLVPAACSGPATPAPQRYFADAKKNIDSLDYEAALKNLERMVKEGGDQPLAQQGTVLRAALLTAMAEASKDMAGAYGTGVKQGPAQARHSQFTRMRADYYGISRVRLMTAMETVMGQRGKLGDKPIRLEMPFPDFSGSEHAAIDKIRKGYWAEERDRFRAELEAVRNALARTLAKLTGAGDDVHKGRGQFDKGGVEIDPRIYLFELSNDFYRLSEIFDRGALDDLRYRRISLEVVRDNMDLLLKLLEAKPDKNLEAQARKLKADCEKALKKLA